MGSQERKSIKKEVEKNLEDSSEILNEKNDKPQGDFVLQEDESLRIVEYKNVGMPLSKKLMIIFSIFLFLVLVAIGIYFANQKGYLDQYKKEQEVPIAAIKEMDLESVEMNVKGISNGKSEVENDDKGKVDEKFSPDRNVNITALNGGGGAGVAGRMKLLLNKDGYENVSADNASDFSHKGVVIYYLSDKWKRDAEEMKKLVESKYSSVSVSKANDGDEKLSDIVVIVGE